MIDDIVMVTDEPWWAVAVNKVDGTPDAWDGFNSREEAELFIAEEMNGNGVLMQRKELVHMLPWWVA